MLFNIHFFYSSCKNVFVNLDSDKYAGCDSDDSDIDDIEIAVVQNLMDPLIIRKPESVKFEIPFNYWKDRDDLISM